MRLVFGSLLLYTCCNSKSFFLAERVMDVLQYMPVSAKYMCTFNNPQNFKTFLDDMRRK